MNVENAPAAARREGSAVHPVSVLVPDSWSAKEGTKGRRKKRNRMFRLRWGWAPGRGNRMISRAEWTSCRVGPVTGYGKEAKAQGTGSLFHSRAGPPPAGTESRSPGKEPARRPPRDKEARKRRLLAVLRDPRELQHDARLCLRTEQPGGQMGTDSLRESRRSGGPAPSSSLRSQHTRAGDLLQASSQRRHMVLTC